MRRIGSNIRKQNTDAKAHRVIKNIIRYTNEEAPRNEYPKRIVSPPQPSGCCSDENREVVGNMREVDGFKFCYKICRKLRPRGEVLFPGRRLARATAVKEYRQWKRYMVQ